MKRAKTLLALPLVGLLLGASADAQTVEIMRGVGEPMNTLLDGGGRLNEASRLMRNWVIVNDPALPVRIRDSQFRGVSPGWSSRDGIFQYRSALSIEVSSPIVAVQINHLLFDVWDQGVRTLRSDHVLSVEGGVHALRSHWPLLNEGEATRHYASLSFVYRVRLADGTVLTTDLGRVLEAAAQVSSAVSLEDLEPDG